MTPSNNIYITENPSHSVHSDAKPQSNNTNRVFSKGILSLKMEEEKLLQIRAETNANRGL